MSSLSEASFDADVPMTSANGGPAPAAVDPVAQQAARFFRQAQHGDRAAFGRIVELYQDRLFNATLRLVGDHEEARELTQEAFTRALVKLDGFRGEAGPYTWLFRIAVNLSISRLRKVQRHRVFSLDRPGFNGDGDQAASLVDRVSRLSRDANVDESPHQAMEKRERNEQVLAALGRLDPEYRAVLIMRDVEGFDYQQMADVLELPLGTLKSRLFRARLSLRDELRPYMKDSMSENENIEARLCSYVEGDLDAAGRAEIEKYLAANPRYRALIADLGRTRGLLHALPRESAPAELLETLHGQLERSALLGDDERGAGNMRISRWPQITAWAAVLLLTGGLAAVIYRVLPSGNKPPELALLPAPSTETAAPSAAAPVAELDKDAEHAVAMKPTALASPTAPVVAAPVAAATENKFTFAAKSSAPIDAPIDDKLALAKDGQSAFTNSTGLPPGPGSNLTTNAAFNSEATATNSGIPERKLLASVLGASSDQRRSNDAASPGRNLYFVVRTRDTDSTHGQVAAYLNDNGIQFQTVNGPAAALTLHTSPKQIATTTITFQGTTMASSARSQFDRVTPLVTAAHGGASAPTTAPAGPVMAKGQSFGMADAVQQVPALAEAQGREVSQSPLYQSQYQQAAPTRDQQLQTQSAADGNTKQANDEQVPVPGEQPATALATSASNVIIARNLTLQQAQSLSDSLSRQKSDVTQFYAEDGPTLAPTTAPAVELAKSLDTDRLAAGDTLRIVAQDTGLKGVEAMNETQTVDADGNINLPLVGKLKASEHSEAELQDSIAHAYRDAKSPTEATWTIQRIAHAPAATTMPSKDEAAAATQPAVAADALDPSPRVDVTILLYGQSVDASQSTTQAAASPEAAAPATQPSDAALAPTTMPAK